MFDHLEEEWEALDKHRKKFLRLAVLEKAAPAPIQQDRAQCSCRPVKPDLYKEEGELIISRMIQLVVANKGVDWGRLIADLSMKNRIPEELCKVPYIPKLAMIRQKVAEELRNTTEPLQMWTIDVKSFFLNFKIRPDCREELGLRFKEGEHWEHYRYTCPPFGLRSSPMICCAYSFTILTLVLRLFPELGDLLWIYVDDFGGVTKKSLAMKQFEMVASVTTFLGLPIGPRP